MKMAIELLGIVIILAAWTLEMNSNLKKENASKDRYKFLMAYIAGFGVLTLYATQTNNIVLAFLFALLALIALLEFVFLMIKRH